MSKIEHIDDLFKSKLAGREVEFDSAAWESAGAALDKHYAGLFWKKFFGIVISLLMIGSAATLWLLPSEPQEELANSALIEQTENVSVQPAIDQVAISGSDSTITATNNQAAITMVTETQAPKKNEPIASNSLKLDAEKLSTSENDQMDLDHVNVSSTVAVAKANKGEQAGNVIYSKGMASIVEGGIIENFLRPMPAFGLPHMNMVVVDTLADAGRPREIINRELRKMVFGVEGGLVFAHGYLNGLAKRERPSVGWHASLQADYHIYPRVYLASGVGLIARGSLANDAAFRLGIEDVVVKPIQAVFLNVPLTVNYRLGARQSVGIGMQYNPLLTAWGTRTSSIAGESAGQSKYVLDKTGLASFDMAAVLDYSCGISERTSVTLHAQYGLFDMTDNLPTSRVDDYNYVLRVGLSYMLLSRVK